MSALTIPYWTEAQFVRRDGWDDRRYPFILPAVRSLEVLRFHPNITFLVGENGSGKSTLIEALAVAWGFNPEGGSRNFNFGTRLSHSDLHRFVRPVRSHLRPRDGYFLRAESYFNVASEIERLDRESDLGPPIIDSYGGRSLHEQSHGESFFALLQERLGGDGLYIFDEPEAALSPQRQLAFLVRMHDLIQARSQFIIATHSPILLAYPDALIYQIGEAGLERVPYENTEHFRITRRFLNDHEGYLRRLLGDDPD